LKTRRVIRPRGKREKKWEKKHFQAAAGSGKPFLPRVSFFAVPIKKKCLKSRRAPFRAGNCKKCGSLEKVLGDGVSEKLRPKNTHFLGGENIESLSVRSFRNNNKRQLWLHQWGRPGIIALRRSMGSYGGFVPPAVCRSQL